MYEYGILKVSLSTLIFCTFLEISDLFYFSCFLDMSEFQCPSLGTLEFLAKIKVKYKCNILEYLYSFFFW